MALHWNFDTDKMGIIINSRGGISHLYRGNAFMIALHEWEKDGDHWYTLNWFFADEKHAKRCMGIGKDEEPMSCIEDWVQIHLDNRYPENRKFLDMLMRIKWSGEVHIYGGKKND